MSVKPFFDTNILVYALTENDPRSEIAQTLLAQGGVTSVQVLNELAAVLRRKFKLTWKETAEALDAVQILCPSIGALTLGIHKRALEIGERYGFNIYDSLVIAAALAAKTAMLYSEDLNDGQVIEETLTIRNPFKG